MSPTPPSSRRWMRGTDTRPAAQLVAQSSAHGVSETTVTWRYVAVRAKDSTAEGDTGGSSS